MKLGDLQNKLRDPYRKFREGFRACTTCGLQGKGVVRSVFVATAHNKMQWFECDGHVDTEHATALQEDPLGDGRRCALVPLTAWLEAIAESAGAPTDLQEDSGDDGSEEDDDEDDEP